MRKSMTFCVIDSITITELFQLIKPSGITYSHSNLQGWIYSRLVDPFLSSLEGPNILCTKGLHLCRIIFVENPVAGLKFSRTGIFPEKLVWKDEFNIGSVHHF